MYTPIACIHRHHRQDKPFFVYYMYLYYIFIYMYHYNM